MRGKVKSISTLWMQASIKMKNESWQKTLHAAVMGGSYVGMACLLSFVLGGNMFSSYITQMVVFAALFPVNLLLILQSGPTNWMKFGCAGFNQAKGIQGLVAGCHVNVGYIFGYVSK